MGVRSWHGVGMYVAAALTIDRKGQAFCMLKFWLALMCALCRGRHGRQATGHMPKRFARFAALRCIEQ